MKRATESIDVNRIGASETGPLNKHDSRPDAFADTIVRPIAFETPDRMTEVESWHGHIPFAFWIVEALAPRVVVELGTHKGDSYCAFCQAVGILRLATTCCAIDNWLGDQHAGFYGEEVFEELRQYHEARYKRFSRLIRSSFDDALKYFADGSIDLLHIDGLHTYDAVKHDFETWRSKLSSRAVVLFHDINVRESDFGVWRLWDELTREYPSFSFTHSHGLGALAIGSDIADPIRLLTSFGDTEQNSARFFFSRLGAAISTGAAAASSKRETLAAADSRLIESDRLSAELTDALEKAEKERGDAIAALAAARIERDEARAALSASESARHLMSAENQGLKAAAQSLRAESESLKNESDSLKNESESLKNEREALKTEVEALRIDNETLRPMRQQLADSDAIVGAELHYLWDSRSRRMFRPLRNLARAIRGLGKETKPSFESKVEELQTIIAIRQSMSWELTAPLRLIHRMLPRRRRVAPANNPIPVTPLFNGRAEVLSRPLTRSVADAGPKPLISVVIPSYNHAAFVAQAIDSIAAQDHANVELIVIDDGSSDSSIGVIEESLKRGSSLRSELHTQQNRGAHAAINRGLELAGGEYLSILNSDDYYYPNRLSNLLSFMREGDHQFAFSEVDHVGPDGCKLPDNNLVRFGYLSARGALPQFPTVGFLLLLYNLTVTSGNFLMRRSLFEKIGGFEPYRAIHDWDYVLRVLVEAEPGFIRQPLMGYRVHENNTLAKSEKEGRLEGPEVIAKYFDSVTRRRAPNRLAPTAYNWPDYFDWFVRNYPNDGTHRLVDFVPAAMNSIGPARCD